MSKILYHYCSLDTFNAIVSNKCLRLSDLSKSNDYMERKWIMNVTEEALIDIFNKQGIKIDLREDYWYSDTINNHISYLYDWLKFYVERSSFITCFSRNGDLLSQWRAYGDNGKGVSIGFNAKLLSKSHSNKNEIYYEDVIYDMKEQIKEIQIAVLNAIDYMKELFNDFPIRLSDNFNEYFVNEFDVFCQVLCDELAILSCYMKNPAFREEDEVRIFYSPVLTIESDNSTLKEHFSKTKRFNNYILKPINFHTRSDQIIGYSDLSFEKLIQKGIIAEIIIGPSSKVTKEDIYFIFTKFGYNSDDILIKQSVSSYRIK